MLKKLWEWFVDWFLDICGYTAAYHQLNEQYSDLQSKYKKLQEVADIAGYDDVYGLKIEISDLRNQLNDAQNQYCTAVERVRELKLYYKNTVSEFDLQLAKNEHEKELSRLRHEIATLQSEIEQLRLDAKNPLGAGRKERGTAEEISRILELRHSGKSLAEIAAIMTNETQSHWGKSTISNILRRTGD